MVSAHHSCAIDNINNLLCWGGNAYGQLGDGTNKSKHLPTTIPLGNDGTFATQISLGSLHSCAIDNLNNLLCWGANFYGQVGGGSSNTTERYTNIPTVISLGDDGYATQISLGGHHSCAIDSNNNLKCWGDNFYGQLGDGTIENKNIPTTVPLNIGGMVLTQISLGFSHSCVLDNFSNLRCWGWNYVGQLGDAKKKADQLFEITKGEYRTTPTLISLGDDGYATQISLGGSQSCAIDNKSKIKCWGNRSFSRGYRKKPTRVDLKRGIPTYAKVSIGILVPVAVILLAIGFYMHMGRRKKRQQGQQQSIIQEVPGDGKPTFTVSNDIEQNSSPPIPGYANDSQLPEKAGVAQLQGLITEPEISVAPISVAPTLPYPKHDESEQ